MSKETLAKSIREIPDFPIPGILFYDVTTLFKDPARLQELSDTLYEMYKDKGITKVVGIESRGFIMGPILATRLGAGFIPIRKPGKLPAETIEESYDKEYGKDTIQIHKDALNENDVVLLHDDLLATGGTMEAACKLVQKMNPKKYSCKVRHQTKGVARNRLIQQRRRRTVGTFIINKEKRPENHMENNPELKTSEYLKGIVLNLPERPRYLPISEYRRGYHIRR